MDEFAGMIALVAGTVGRDRVRGLTVLGRMRRRVAGESVSVAAICSPHGRQAAARDDLLDDIGRRDARHTVRACIRDSPAHA